MRFLRVACLVVAASGLFVSVMPTAAIEVRVVSMGILIGSMLLFITLSRGSRTDVRVHSGSVAERKRIINPVDWLVVAVLLCAVLGSLYWLHVDDASGGKDGTPVPVLVCTVLSLTMYLIYLRRRLTK